MKTEEARANIGRLVMSRDPGYKCVRKLPEHGPYRLLRVTKAGLAILETREDHRVPTSLIRLAEDKKAVAA
jgi:hypothetical protein